MAKKKDNSQKQLEGRELALHLIEQLVQAGVGNVVSEFRVVSGESNGGRVTDIITPELDAFGRPVIRRERPS